MRESRREHEMVERLRIELEEDLLGVVVYGPSARDDADPVRYLAIVTLDLLPGTLRRLAAPVAWWIDHGEPWPRLFSPELLRASADTFPIELLDIATHRRMLFGADPVAGITIDRVHLRIQCERELREKLMRLREGYVACHRAPGASGMRELLAASYPSFARIFRACLYLLGAAVPHRDRDVVAALCEQLDLAPAAFTEIERGARGERIVDAEAAFAAYYHALMIAERRIDHLIIHEGKAP